MYRFVFSSWETYQIEVNALALRGSLASQCVARLWLSSVEFAVNRLNKKKVDAEYEIECWGVHPAVSVVFHTAVSQATSNHIR